MASSQYTNYNATNGLNLNLNPNTLKTPNNNQLHSRFSPSTRHTTYSTNSGHAPGALGLIKLNHALNNFNLNFKKAVPINIISSVSEFRSVVGGVKERLVRKFPWAATENERAKREGIPNKNGNWNGNGKGVGIGIGIGVGNGNRSGISTTTASLLWGGSVPESPPEDRVKKGKDKAKERTQPKGKDKHKGAEDKGKRKGSRAEVAVDRSEAYIPPSSREGYSEEGGNSNRVKRGTNERPTMMSGAALDHAGETERSKTANRSIRPRGQNIEKTRNVREGTKKTDATADATLSRDSGAKGIGRGDNSPNSNPSTPGSMTLKHLWKNIKTRLRGNGRGNADDDEESMVGDIIHDCVQSGIAPHRPYPAPVPSSPSSSQSNFPSHHSRPSRLPIRSQPSTNSASNNNKGKIESKEKSPMGTQENRTRTAIDTSIHPALRSVPVAERHQMRPSTLSSSGGAKPPNRQNNTKSTGASPQKRLVKKSHARTNVSSSERGSLREKSGTRNVSERYTRHSKPRSGYRSGSDQQASVAKKQVQRSAEKRNDRIGNRKKQSSSTAAKAGQGAIPEKRVRKQSNATTTSAATTNGVGSTSPNLTKTSSLLRKRFSGQGTSSNHESTNTSNSVQQRKRTIPTPSSPIPILDSVDLRHDHSRNYGESWGRRSLTSYVPRPGYRSGGASTARSSRQSGSIAIGIEIPPFREVVEGVSGAGNEYGGVRRSAGVGLGIGIADDELGVSDGIGKRVRMNSGSQTGLKTAGGTHGDGRRKTMRASNNGIGSVKTDKSRGGRLVGESSTSESRSNKIKKTKPGLKTGNPKFDLNGKRVEEKENVENKRNPSISENQPQNFNPNPSQIPRRTRPSISRRPISSPASRYSIITLEAYSALNEQEKQDYLLLQRFINGDIDFPDAPPSTSASSILTAIGLRAGTSSGSELGFPRKRVSASSNSITNSIRETLRRRGREIRQEGASGNDYQNVRAMGPAVEVDEEYMEAEEKGDGESFGGELETIEVGFDAETLLYLRKNQRSISISGARNPMTGLGMRGVESQRQRDVALGEVRKKASVGRTTRFKEGEM